MSKSGPTVVDDDDVQIVEDQVSNEHTCAFCNESLEPLDEGARQHHYELHFREQDPSSDVVEVLPASNNPSTKPTSSSATNATNKPTMTNGLSSFTGRKKNQGAFWTVSKANGTPPPNNYTAGLIPILKRALTKTHAKGVTRRAVLCRDGVAHIQSEFFDLRWGCGYRNYMMGCTALYEQETMPQYRSLLDQHGGPSVRNLQTLIEQAWSDGYDKLGAVQLKSKLANTSKWIGTGDIYVAFTYCGIPAKLVDFPDVTDPHIVTQWVANYFLPPTPSSSSAPKNVQQMLNGASPVVVTEKMPLILQHQGHSRTIVGIEFNKSGAPNLLMFDPAKRIPGHVRTVAHSSLPHSQASKSSSPHQSHTKRAINKILHPLKNSNGKRPRANIFSDTENGDDDIVEVDVIDVDEPNPKRIKGGASGTKLEGQKARVDGDDLDPLKTLNLFRVNLNQLKKKDQYQILEFTLDQPLTPSEKWQRRVVTSERVT